MLKFIIDIFCKDTIVGLSQFDSKRYKSLYKNKYSSLFKKTKEYSYKRKYFSTDQYAYHL